jgi:hypothetical protein
MVQRFLRGMESDMYKYSNDVDKLNDVDKFNDEFLILFMTILALSVYYNREINIIREKIETCLM